MGRSVLLKEYYVFITFSSFQNSGVCGGLVGLGLLESVSYVKSIATLDTLLAVGKRGPDEFFTLCFVWLSSPLVVEFVGT